MIKKKILFAILILAVLSAKCHAQNFGISSNLTATALGCLTLETSVAISARLSLHLPLLWAPFEFKENCKLKLFALQPGVRWWLWHVYSGFFAGSYATYTRFNFGIYSYRHDGYAGGISLSGGYSRMLSRSWNIEIELGGGLFYTNYDLFKREPCGEYLNSSSGVKLIPSKINLSVVYIL